MSRSYLESARNARWSIYDGHCTSARSIFKQCERNTFRSSIDMSAEHKAISLSGKAGNVVREHRRNGRTL